MRKILTTNLLFLIICLIVIAGCKKAVHMGYVSGNFRNENGFDKWKCQNECVKYCNSINMEVVLDYSGEVEDGNGPTGKCNCYCRER